MPSHRVYSAIVKAVGRGKLKEPFTNDDFRKQCPGFGNGMYAAFLYKHRVGNPGSNSELFVLQPPGKFRLLRPLKYQIPNPSRVRSILITALPVSW
jgi:hypothetical protein